MEEKLLFIVAGANGSGKTTVSRNLLNDYHLEFLNADDLARELEREHPEKARIRAGKLMLERMDTLVKSGVSFALETTLAGKYLEKKIGTCRHKGYRVILLYLFLDSPQVAINRIRTRVKNGGHSIPPEDVKRRFHRSMKNFWFCYRDLVDEWILYYNGEDMIVQVATGWQGTIEVNNEIFFKSFRKGL